MTSAKLPKELEDLLEVKVHMKVKSAIFNSI